MEFLAAWVNMNNQVTLMKTPLGNVNLCHADQGNRSQNIAKLDWTCFHWDFAQFLCHTLQDGAS